MYGLLQTTKAEEFSGVISLYDNGTVKDSSKSPYCGRNQRISLSSYEFGIKKCNSEERRCQYQKKPLSSEAELILHNGCSFKQECDSLNFSTLAEQQNNILDSVVIGYDCLGTCFLLCMNWKCKFISVKTSFWIHQNTVLSCFICFPWYILYVGPALNEPPHDKTNKMACAPAITQISLGIRPVWSESSLCAQWVVKDPRFLHADSEYIDQTERMPRFESSLGAHTILLILSWGGSNNLKMDLEVNVIQYSKCVNTLRFKMKQLTAIL